MTGCNGECCVAFPMNDITHAQIVELRDKHPEYLEYDKYVDMLIVIGDNPFQRGQMFTCRHHDPITKRCNEYAGRPLLCSQYPYGDVCKHCWLTHVQLNGRELA